MGSLSDVSGGGAAHTAMSGRGFGGDEANTYPNPLQDHPAYAAVRQYFVEVDDTVAQKRLFLSTRIVQEELIFDVCWSRQRDVSRWHNTKKIVDSIQDRRINQVYIIGGDGTQKGASVIFEEIRRRGLKVAVVGIPKTIDNDIPVIDKSFGFDSAVEEAQSAINAAHVEATSIDNGIGLVKLMGRYSGFIAMYATIASRDVDCCLIPESPFYLEGAGGLLEYVEKRLKENGHMVIVMAEGAGQELLSDTARPVNQEDASGNKLLEDIGIWIVQKIKDYFSNKRNMHVNLKYIDPTYMIRAIPSNASDNVYCTLLAQSAVHGAMAGYTGFTVGPVNGRHAYIPFHRITEKQNKVVITDRMWARLLSSTNQPSFLNKNGVIQATKNEKHPTELLDDGSAYSFIAMYATLASRDVDCWLIPESPFYLEGAGGLLEYIEKRIKENRHMVIVMAKGAGQELLSDIARPVNQQDALGNKLLQDIGPWIVQKIKVDLLLSFSF
ncbi:ATP-dependent 6-phosphofructokinase [Sesamum alatum]|uniref:ATP-dependent 6-phosphofructokinase n=1 Tax=Sesamum alatum TaxID=300844 RepID=A0AAE1XPE6_9LAMI|nr:ATP-dependent 6-phosphofructokinase [Sesamum alatum]